jgi:hypothetical protein
MHFEMEGGRGGGSGALGGRDCGELHGSSPEVRLLEFYIQASSGPGGTAFPIFIWLIFFFHLFGWFSYWLGFGILFFEIEHRILTSYLLFRIVFYHIHAMFVETIFQLSIGFRNVEWVRPGPVWFNG